METHAAHMTGLVEGTLIGSRALVRAGCIISGSCLNSGAAEALASVSRGADADPPVLLFFLAVCGFCTA